MLRRETPLPLFGLAYSRRSRVLGLHAKGRCACAATNSTPVCGYSETASFPSREAPVSMAPNVLHGMLAVGCAQALWADPDADLVGELVIRRCELTLPICGASMSLMTRKNGKSSRCLGPLDGTSISALNTHLQSQGLSDHDRHEVLRFASTLSLPENLRQQVWQNNGGETVNVDLSEDE